MAGYYENGYMKNRVGWWWNRFIWLRTGTNVGL
jgi:hypothetical protein